MSLSRREQLLLDRAAVALRRADPDLAAKLARFGQAAGGEPVPGHEQLSREPGWPRRIWAALGQLAHPARRRHHGLAQPARGAPGIVQEDTMPAIPRVSPLPPDRTRSGHSPLPPDPARRDPASPLPPDPGLPDVSPVPRPRPAPDDTDQATGTGTGTGDEPGPGAAGPR